MTIKLIFASDIHLDHLSPKQFVEFCDLINNSGSNGVAITGDISTGDKICSHLSLLAKYIKLPIYYVLGNHDYWFKSIQTVYDEVAALPEDNLFFLDRKPVIELSPTTAIIGHSGFYDGLNGNIDKSSFFPTGMPEFRFVNDFKYLSPYQKKNKLIELTTTAADYLEVRLSEALKKYDTIYCLTHVPPYLLASRHEGLPADKNSAPFFSNRIIGERLSNTMKAYPNKQLVVLCGHTHAEFVCNPAPNVTVYVAGVEYGKPNISRIFDIF